ncbi:MAG TPA: DUF1097 domain-containing protein [Gemmatimonadales bacterium]|jgi:hypothetical protein|nr:DUF1097 domain-containing protein [Gemmatimonadales bacterium]
MSQLVALSISIGLLGGIATFIYLKLGLAIWAGFIAWACFFHCGGDSNALKQTIVGNIFGAICAWIAAFIILSFPLGDRLGLPLWAGIVVGITVFIMCIAAHLKALAVIPASVYGYAATFAYLLLTAQAMVIAEMTAVDFKRNAFLFIVISMVLGALFGMASAKLGAALAKKA